MNSFPNDRQTFLFQRLPAEFHRIGGTVRQAREGIEGTLRGGQGDAPQRLEPFGEQCAPAVVTARHLAHTISGALDRCQGTPLGKAAHIAGALALQS